jgi:hypothetical protein
VLRGRVVLGATEDFLNWMQSVHMPSVASVLGPHAYMLTRYGVSPDEDVATAVAKLKTKAPHLAKFLQEVTQQML